MPNLAFEFYKLAIQERDLELKLFWQRSMFFAAFIAAIFVGYNNINNQCPSENANTFIKSLLLILGALLSITWCLANRGSKYWYESWELKVEACERMLGANLFAYWNPSQHKYWLYRARRYSVSKLAIYVSDLVFLSWLALLFNRFAATLFQSFLGYEIPAALIVVLILLYLLFVRTRTTKNDLK